MKKNYSSVMRLDMIIISYLVKMLNIENRQGFSRDEIEKHITNVRTAMNNYAQQKSEISREDFSVLDEKSKDAEAVQQANFVPIQKVLDIIDSTSVFSVHYDYRSTPEKLLYVITASKYQYDNLPENSPEAVMLNYYAYPNLLNDDIIKQQEEILEEHYGVLPIENKLDDGYAEDINKNTRLIISQTAQEATEEFGQSHQE